MTTTAALALVAVLVAGCGGDDDEDTTASESATPEKTEPANQQEAVSAVVKVSIGENFYKPKKVTITRGQSISWRNQGKIDHTVTSDTDSAAKFDSGKLGPNSAYALKPTSAGDITYHCTIHGKSQAGTITVNR